MKTLRIVCPTCGAHLDVDINSCQARCRFCNEIFSLDTRNQTQTQTHPQFDAEQMGYDFEIGRQRANVEFTQGFADRMAEARTHMPAPESVYVPQPVYYVPEPAKPVRQGLPVWALVMLWLIFPPAGLVATIVTLARNANISQDRRAAIASIWSIVLVLWIICSMMAIVF